MTRQFAMQSATLREKPEGCQGEAQQKSFVWDDNPDVQKLLDVVVSILAEEYIQVAERNSDVFSSGSGTTPSTYPPHPITLPQGEKGKTNKNGG